MKLYMRPVWVNDGVVVLTCMFVMRMCFLALVTASLLQEESSTLHHEEALTEAANKQEKQVIRQQFSKTALACLFNNYDEWWDRRKV